MDYHITFDDGSSAYLAHHGVLGMKWGVRNAETRAKYAQAGSGRKYRLASRGDQYSRSVTNRRREYNANQSRAKQVLKNVILTPAGAHAYNTSRSRGLSREDALMNASAGWHYAQGVKHKQRKLGTTDVRISEQAKARAEYGNRQSLGKTVIKNMLGGPHGAMAYNRAKASNQGRGKAAVKALGAVLLVSGASYASRRYANSKAAGSRNEKEFYRNQRKAAVVGAGLGLAAMNAPRIAARVSSGTMPTKKQIASEGAYLKDRAKKNVNTVKNVAKTVKRSRSSSKKNRKQ